MEIRWCISQRTSVSEGWCWQPLLWSKGSTARAIVPYAVTSLLVMKLVTQTEDHWFAELCTDGCNGLLVADYVRNTFRRSCVQLCTTILQVMCTNMIQCVLVEHHYMVLGINRNVTKRSMNVVSTSYTETWQKWLQKEPVQIVVFGHL